MVTHPLGKFDEHKLLSQLEKVFVVLLGAYLSLNFLGSPLVKFLYLLFPVIIAGVILFYPARNSFIFFSLYLWIEGQGRVLWGYSAWARVIFDALLALAILKEFYNQRKVFHPSSIPSWIKAMVGLHLVIFFLEIFNPIGIGPIQGIATSKIYIYPVLLFLFFNSIEAFEGELLDKIIRYTLLMILIQCLLSYYQMSQGHKFMLGISPSYFRAMSNGKFVGRLFRPFGTSFVSGGISTYLYAFTPLLFLSKRYLRYAIVLLPFVFATLFICQVRSAMVKLAVFLVLLFILQLAFRQIKVRGLITGIIVLLLSIPLYQNFSSKLALFSDEIDLSESQTRFSRITEGGQRIGPKEFYGLLAHRILQAPLGYGPGLTGAAASIGMDSFLQNKLVSIGDVWSYDNFYLSLFTDFGVLALIYLTLIIGIPFAALAYFWRKKSFLSSDLCHRGTVALAASFVLLLGNWGAIGLPYNPESFAFWYWMSILTVGISGPNA